MRIIGWLAMTLGVVGVIVGVLFAAGLWVVKPNIEARFDGLVVAADTGLARAMNLTDAVSGKLEVVDGRIADLRQKADDLGALPIFNRPIATALTTAIVDFVSGPYTALRADYVALRERATNVGETLRALDNAIPAVTLPGTAMERLQNLDARLTEIDATLTQVAEDGASALDQPGIPERISARLGEAQATIANLDSLVTGVEDSMQETRDKLAAANATFSNVLTFTAIGATLFGLYFAGLNFLLIRQGRRWSQRKKAAASATPE